MTNSANRLFEDAAGEILHATWERYPSTASGMGLHQYDGRLPDLTRRALADRAREIERGVDALERIDITALSATNYYDHHILAAALRKELLELTELRWHETNPLELLWHIELSGYIQRDYAPLASARRCAHAGAGRRPRLSCRPEGRASAGGWRRPCLRRLSRHTPASPHSTITTLWRRSAILTTANCSPNSK